MPGGRSWDEWVAQYAQSHQHPFNRLCHTVGIPLIVLSLLIDGLSADVSALRALGPGWTPHHSSEAAIRIAAADLVH